MFDAANFYIKLEIGGTGAIILALIAGAGLIWLARRFINRAPEHRLSSGPHDTERRSPHSAVETPLAPAIDAQPRALLPVRQTAPDGQG
jgi:hypothetical protein